jgi:hypothetical protein
VLKGYCKKLKDAHVPLYSVIKQRLLCLILLVTGSLQVTDVITYDVTMVSERSAIDTANCTVCLILILRLCRYSDEWDM